MKYIAKLNGNIYEIELEKIEGNYVPITRDTDERVVPNISQQSVISSSKTAPQITSTPAKDFFPNSSGVISQGNTLERTQKDDNNKSGEIVLSPMPGNIWQIAIGLGDKVKAGDTVVVLEAMKMENEIVATVDGEITAIYVSKGQAVDTDTALIEIS